MKKFCYVICFSICIFIVGCSINENDLRKNINNTVFENAKVIAVVKVTETKYLKSLIKDEELNIIKDELKKIKNIRKIKINPSDFFKEYHLSFIFYNGSKKSKTVLYSTSLKLMMIREHDIFPEKPRSFPEIYVYRFKIPEKVLEILKEHENKLPNEGEFIDNWPFD